MYLLTTSLRFIRYSPRFICCASASAAMALFAAFGPANSATTPEAEPLAGADWVPLDTRCGCPTCAAISRSTCNSAAGTATSAHVTGGFAWLASLSAMGVCRSLSGTDISTSQSRRRRAITVATRLYDTPQQKWRGSRRYPSRSVFARIVRSSKRTICRNAISIGYTRCKYSRYHSAARRSDSVLKITNRLQRRSTWRAKGPNIPHGRLAEEAAVFAIELAGALVSDLERRTGGVQTIHEHAFPRCMQPKLLLILKRTHGGQHPEMVVQRGHA